MHVCKCVFVNECGWVNLCAGRRFIVCECVSMNDCVCVSLCAIKCLNV